MRIANVVKVEKGGRIEVPPELSCILEFWENTQVFFRLIESQYYKEDEELREYVLWVAPLIPDPRVLDRLYKIEFVLGDEPGSFSAFSQLLRKHKVRLQIGESRTTICNVRAEGNEIAWFEGLPGGIEDLNVKIEEEISNDNTGTLRKKIKPILYEARFGIHKSSILEQVEIGFKQQVQGNPGITEPSINILGTIQSFLRKYLIFPKVWQQ